MEIPFCSDQNDNHDDDDNAAAVAAAAAAAAADDDDMKNDKNDNNNKNNNNNNNHNELIAMVLVHGPFTRYVKLRVAPGNAGNVFPAPISKEPLVSDPGLHHVTCVTHVPLCMSGSLTHGGKKNVSDIPGPCATRNFTYPSRGSWHDCCAAVFIIDNNGDMVWNKIRISFELASQITDNPTLCSTGYLV